MSHKIDIQNYGGDNTELWKGHIIDIISHKNFHLHRFIGDITQVTDDITFANNYIRTKYYELNPTPKTSKYKQILCDDLPNDRFMLEFVYENIYENVDKKDFSGKLIFDNIPIPFDKDYTEEEFTIFNKKYYCAFRDNKVIIIILYNNYIYPISINISKHNISLSTYDKIKFDHFINYFDENKGVVILEDGSEYLILIDLCYEESLFGKCKKVYQNQDFCLFLSDYNKVPNVICKYEKYFDEKIDKVDLKYIKLFREIYDGDNEKFRKMYNFIIEYRNRTRELPSAELINQQIP